MRGVPLAMVAALATAGVRGGEAPPFDAQGHRGARGLAPENTLAAFTRALGIGVHTLELDAVVTRDGVVVVRHEPRLLPDLTRDARGEWVADPGPLVLDLDLGQLVSYDVGRARPGGRVAEQFPEQVPADGERVPTLAAVLALAEGSGVRFNIETKISPLAPEETLDPEAFARAVIDVVREAGAIERSAIQSFDWRTLRHAAQIAPDLERVCLTTRRPEGGTLQVGRDGAPPWLAGLDADDHAGSVPRLVREAGCAVWSPNHRDLEPASLAEAHDLGLRVVVWTVNDPQRMDALIGMGVDGIISDYPDRLRAVMERRGMALPAPVSP